MSEYKIGNILDTILDTLYSDPVYLVIAIILCALLAYSLIKRLLKLMIYVFLLVVIYFSFLYFTGNELPKSYDDFWKKMENLWETIEDGIQENIIDPVINSKDENNSKGGNDA